jgi:hypothetical protein
MCSTCEVGDADERVESWVVIPGLIAWDRPVCRVVLRVSVSCVTYTCRWLPYYCRRVRCIARAARRPPVLYLH